jgi:hypothetical protein
VTITVAGVAMIRDRDLARGPLLTKPRSTTDPFQGTLVRSTAAGVFLVLIVVRPAPSV